MKYIVTRDKESNLVVFYPIDKTVEERIRGSATYYWCPDGRRIDTLTDSGFKPFTTSPSTPARNE